MIFTKHNIKRLKLFIYGIPLSFLSLILPRKSRVIFNSTHNENFTFNSKYLFEYFLKEHPEIEVKFVINVEKRRKELIEEYGDHFISTNSLKDALLALQAKVWVTSTLETPVGGFWHSFRRCVIHLGHGTPLKNIGLLEKNIGLVKRVYYFLVKSNFSYLVSSSNETSSIWANFMSFPLSRIIVLGQSRSDLVYTPHPFPYEDSKIKILYAPTWRPNSRTKIFPFDDFNLEALESFLGKNNAKIFLRLHPLNQEDIKNQYNSKSIKVFNSHKCVDINEQLGNFDFVVTDYSSIFIDFLKLNRPMIFLPYDIEEYSNQIGFTVNYNKFTPGPKPQTMNDFMQVISKSINDKSFYNKERIFANKYFNSDIANARTRAVNFILKFL